MAFKNLEQQFNEKMKELYSPVLHPAKDSPSDLHPLITYTPDDPDRPQGTGDASRLYPVPHVLTDQERMTRWLTSPVGLRWLVGQEVLQTGNAISETRRINPAFINLNLTPTAHFKRSLRDQQSVTVADPLRSPASTPQIGIAGRLQKETADASIAGLLNRPSFGNTVVSLLKATQIASPIKGLLGAAIGQEGTLGVNQRPEFNVTEGKDYYTIQYEGVQQTLDTQMANVARALEFVGGAASTIGLPNLFSGLRTPTNSPLRQAGSDDARRVRSWMPYYASVGKSYYSSEVDFGFRPESLAYSPLALSSLSTVIPDSVFRAGEDAVRFLDEQFQRVLSTGAGRFVASVASTLGVGLPAPTARATIVSQAAWANVTPQRSSDLKPSDQMSDVARERSVSRMFERAAPNKKTAQRSKKGTLEVTTQLSEDALSRAGTDDPRIERVRRLRQDQQNAMEKWNDVRQQLKEDGAVPFERGIRHGITVNDTTSPVAGDSVDSSNTSAIVDEDSKVAFFATKVADDGTGRKRYYMDAINLPTSIVQGQIGGERAEPDSEFPDDYVKFRILDFANNRLLIFRAMVQTIVETHAPEYTETKYIGRIERNVVYTGNVRTVLVTFYVHAFSPEELPILWQKVNYLSGLTFPSRYSERGYMLPPFVEFTIGDMYLDQPGYISTFDVTVEEDANWEIDEGRQVPLTLMINATFTLIEKDQMASATGRVYGYPIKDPTRPAKKEDLSGININLI